MMVKFLHNGYGDHKDFVANYGDLSRYMVKIIAIHQYLTTNPNDRLGLLNKASLPITNHGVPCGFVDKSNHFV